MSDEKEKDKKMLESLKNLSKKLDGLQKQSCEYRIKQLEQKINPKTDKNYDIINLEDIVSESIVKQKIKKEENIINGYDKMLALDESLGVKLNPKKNLCKKKIMLLNNFKNLGEDSLMKEYGVKTSGSVNIEILEFSSDPLFECHGIEFYVDNVQKKAIKSNFRGMVSIELVTSVEFEILLVGKDDVLIGILFFPCSYLLNYKDRKTVDICFSQNATLKVNIEFQREIRLIRKNAEVITIFKQGHAFENYTDISTYYCCVCNKLATLSQTSRCNKCQFTCHKKCINYVLFNCPRGKFLEDTRLTKRYNIDHLFKDSKSSGLKWCGHCGTRITMNSECVTCEKCKLSFHKECKDLVFKACGLTYELRKSMADFNPPPPEKTKQDVSISINDFSLIKVLGRGSF